MVTLVIVDGPLHIGGRALVATRLVAVVAGEVPGNFKPSAIDQCHVGHGLGWGWRLAAALAGAAMAAGIGATPAQAHTELKYTIPAAGTTIDGSPTAVLLVFSSAVKEQFTTVIVLDAAGTTYGDDVSRVTGVTVTQPVRPLPPGRATVTWRTVAADGAPAQGTFSFRIAGATTSVAATGPATGAIGPPTAETAREGVRWSAWWWLTAFGVMLLVAATGTVTWPWFGPRLAPAVRRAASWRAR